MPRVRIDLEANSATLDRTERLADFFEGLATGPKKALKDKIAQEVRWGFAENFAQEQAGDEGRWQPLAKRTVAERQAQGFMGEHPILVRTGEYMKSWTQPGAGHYSKFDAGLTWEWTEGSTDPRVGELEGGEDATIPERPVRFLAAKNEARISALLDAYFTTQAPKK